MRERTFVVEFWLIADIHVGWGLSQRKISVCQDVSMDNRNKKLIIAFGSL